MLIDHALPESPCLGCGKRLDAASSVTSDAGPDPGDATVCLDCGYLMIFKDDLTLRMPTIAELCELAGDARVMRTQALVAAYRRRFKKDG